MSRTEDETDRRDPLFLFLGGDGLALRILRALRRKAYITTVDELREIYFFWGDPGEYLADHVNIGPVSLARIGEKLTEQ